MTPYGRIAGRKSFQEMYIIYITKSSDEQLGLMGLGI